VADAPEPIRLGFRLVQLFAEGVLRGLYGVKVMGAENVPPTGRFILAVNHRSNLDPPLLGSLTPREVHFFAKEELFRRQPLAGFISYLNAFPVRRGGFDRASLIKCVEILKRDRALIMFPEGTRAPRDGFLRAKIGLGWVACLAQAPVLPVYVHGTATAKPRLTGRPSLYVIYGHLIPFAELRVPQLSGKALYQQVSDTVLERIRELSLQTPRGLVTQPGPVYERDIIEDERLR
jgi:1-acyl-sn-glycerol-3-phosphate acyltransferase